MPFVLKTGYSYGNDYDSISDIDDCYGNNDDDNGDDAVPGMIVCIISSLVCISD